MHGTVYHQSGTAINKQLCLERCVYTSDAVLKIIYVFFSLQGAGTAVGELPPYFMARAARLSGVDLEDDEFEEIEELIHEKKDHPEDLVSDYVLWPTARGTFSVVHRTLRSCLAGMDFCCELCLLRKCSSF